MRSRKLDFKREGQNMSKTVKDANGVEWTVTENPEKVKDGEIVETFSITVKNEEEGQPPHYKNEEEPFKWTKVSSLPAALQAEGAKLSDDQLLFLNDALAVPEQGATEEQKATGKAVSSIVEIYNAYVRGNAKNNQYQRVMTDKKPMTEERREQAFESMVKLFATLNKVSLDQARKTLSANMSQAQ